MKRFYIFLGMVLLFLGGCNRTLLPTKSEFITPQSLGVLGFDQVNDLTADSTDVYLAGERPDGSTTEEGSSYSNGYTRKYNVGSNFLNFAWDKTLGVKNRSDTALSIAADNAGNVYTVDFYSGRDPNTGFLSLQPRCTSTLLQGHLFGRKLLLINL
jgi:hypothetical protein